MLIIKKLAFEKMHNYCDAYGKFLWNDFEKFLRKNLNSSFDIHNNSGTGK